MANRNSRLVVPVRAASFDGRYWGRYPFGDKPNTGAVLSAGAAAVAAAQAQLTTVIRMGGTAADIAAAQAGLNSAIKLAASAQSRASATGSLPSGGNVIWDPGDLGAYSTANQVFTYDINRYGEPSDNPANYAVVSLQSTVTRPGGSSKAIQITYPADEAGAELYFAQNFTATKTLYVRWRMMLDAGWKNNWPVGLKTTRAFTNGTTYHSPKMIWSKYLDGSGFAPDGPGTAHNDYVWGCCSAAYNLDVGAAYSPSLNFDNGLPYVRAGVWYLYEIYHQMNSADGVADGKLEMRIDRKPVYVNNAFKWEESARGASGGLAGFTRMWFGGNFSGGDRGFTSGSTLYRYEDGYRVCDYADWVP